MLKFVIKLIKYGAISLVFTGCSGLSLREENDFFTLFNEDRYYSQGLEISKRFGDNSLGIGNKVYTPNDKWRKDLIKEDRPYVGYSYIYAARRGARFDSLLGADQIDDRIEVGLVGPGAGGEHVQNKFHDLIGNARFHGWNNQIANEPILNYYHTETWIKRPFSIGHIESGVRAGVGNLDTSILGFNRYVVGGRLGDFHYEVFAGVDSKLKGRDITLDGNTFSHSHSVDKKPVVATASAGLCVRRGSWFLGYVYKQSTKEFDGQEYGHSFGSVLIGYGECR